MQTSTLQLRSFLPYRLSYTANLVSELIAGAYERRFALSIPEWRVLVHVAEAESISQREICRSARMDKVTISRATISLVKRHMIERRINPRDGRSLLLALTGQGNALYESIAPEALRLEREIFRAFSGQEMDLLDALLLRIDRAVLAVLHD